MQIGRHLRTFSLSIVISIFAQLFAHETTAASWDDAIEVVSEKAEEYHDYAVAVGGTSWAGTMYNGYKSVEHQCAILGRMLGKPEAIKHIEQFEYPPMDARSEPHDLLVFAISLRNWVASARWANEASRDQRINRWNLDCVGKFGIASNLSMKSENPDAEFEVQGNQLHVYGDIDFGFAERFAVILKANPSITEVTLGSGGGSVHDALLAGVMIRQRGLNTTIYGNCFSACPLVFMGGNRRVVWAAPYRLGFHQIYTGGGVAIPLDDKLYGFVSQYVARMGGEPRYVLSWMFSASPSQMYEPKPQELCDAVVATFVQRICGIDMLR